MTFCCSLKVLTHYCTSLLLLEKLPWPLLLQEMTPCLSLTWMMTSLQEMQQLSPHSGERGGTAATFSHFVFDTGCFFFFLSSPSVFSTAPLISGNCSFTFG